MPDKPWSSIDTAPKDGRPFQGWNGIRQVVVSWWSPYREGEGDFGDAHGRRIEPPLTEWTELPGRPS